MPLLCTAIFPFFFIMQTHVRAHTKARTVTPLSSSFFHLIFPRALRLSLRKSATNSDLARNAAQRHVSLAAASLSCFCLFFAAPLQQTG